MRTEQDILSNDFKREHKIMSKSFYQKDIDEILDFFNSDLENGLSHSEIKKKEEEYGRNKISESKGVSPLKILLNQIRDLVIIILIVASGLAFLIGEHLEAYAILAVIFFNTVIGFLSEYNAQKAMSSLKEVLSEKAVVIRESNVKEIPAEELLPGDIILIDEGDRIPADARLLSSQNLSINEASLTGESQSVEKDAESEIEEETTLAERNNMVYMGTNAVRGKAKAVVTATAEDTEIGQIGEMLDYTEEEETPLEQRLDKLGKSLVYITLAVITVLTVIGIFMGRPWLSTIKTGIALAIAAVPEGLPIIATVTLAIGMRNMVKNNALVRELLAVETLGSVTTICTDKTGTITENEMTLRKLFLGNKIIEISGSGYQPEGKFYRDEEELNPADEEDLKLALKASALCTSAELSKEDNSWEVIGEPTEGALLTAAKKAGLSKKSLKEEGYIKTAEIPFNSDNMYMAVAYKLPDKSSEVYLKGSPEVVLDFCSTVLIDGEEVNLDEEKREIILEENKKLGKDGLRILGTAYKNTEELNSEEKIEKEMEDGLCFLALTAIIDPPREGVIEDIAEAKTAGINIKMITGDQKDTASAVAEEIGIDKNGSVITGQELSSASDEEIKNIVRENSVFCRVTPKNKLQIIECLNSDQEITAMTGDGVNDAPALKRADIGVSMGQRGTSVAREASDMILLDDDFTTIIKAVREGRVIFDNIQKFIYYLFSNNLSKIIYIFIAILFNFPLPLLAMQILWINVVIDVLPALSLAWEKEEKNIMQRSPDKHNKDIMTPSFSKKVIYHSFILAAGPMLVYLWFLNNGYSIELSRSISFALIAYTQLFHVFNARRKSGLAFDKTLLENKYLWAAVLLGFIFQTAALYLPFLQGILSTTAVPFELFLPASLGFIIPMLIIQVSNYFSSD